MTTINDLFPSRFLKASDLKCQRRTVTIAKITREEVGKGKEKKAVVYFAGVKKGLILNKTNATKIAKVLGSEAIDQWVGKKITLFSAEVEFAGDLMAAIRVMSPNGVESAPVEDADSEDVFSSNGDDDSVFHDDGREPGSDDGTEDNENPFA